MFISTTHLRALKQLANSENAGRSVYTLTEDDSQQPVYRLLELQGLVLLEVPRSYRLTYAGQEALRLIEAMAQAKLLPPLDQFKADWHWMDSIVGGALQTARRNKGRVGPLTTQLLSSRGLTENVYDAVQQRSFVRLNKYGEAWADFIARYRPRLEIDGALANSLCSMQMGYSSRPGATIPAEHIALLEAMELLVWSIPEGKVSTLTALGQAVYNALRKGGGYAPLTVVLNEPILEVLALLVDQGRAALTSEQRTNLYMLGYIESDDTLTAAGQAAMYAYSLLQRESDERSPTFAITEAEGELLVTIHQLNEASHESQLQPDKQTLHRVLVDRMVKRYQDYIGHYGRTIKEQPARKRQVVELLEQLKSHEEWFNTFWDLDQLLVSLEAFELVRAEREGAKTVYRLTPTGYQVVLEQEGNARDITATAVKVLTSVCTRLQAPADSWVEQAREEGLIGAGGVTKAGRFYAVLARHCERKLALTRMEAEVLTDLPHTVNEIPALATRDRGMLDEEKRFWAFEKLEARGYIDRLVDGQIVRTPLGEQLARAVSGALHLGHPVTPTIIRLLAAMRQVGTLYVKERKVRIQPEKWVEVERLTGLGPQEFKEVVHVARLGHYIGEVTITESGLDLLAVHARLEEPQA